MFLFQDWFSVPIESTSLCSTATETVTAIPKWVYYSFFLGATASVTTILWSVWKTPEIPPTDEEFKHLQYFKQQPFLDKVLHPLKEIYNAIGGMPKLMWQLVGVYFFQWYALFCYWQFITPMLRTSLFGISNSDTEKYDGIMEACKSGEEISAIDLSFAQNIQLLSEQALAQTGLTRIIHRPPILGLIMGC